MDAFSAWWNPKPQSFKLLMVAIAIMFVSQFFQYQDDTNWGVLGVDADYNTSLTYTVGGPEPGTGWHVHSLVYLALPALLVVYLSQIRLQPFWVKYGRWIAVALMFACAVPGTIRVTGGKLGILAIGLAIVAAVLEGRERKAAEAPPPAPHRHR